MVALKVPSGGTVLERRALRREAEALSALDHPSVVGLVDADLDAEVPWLALEMVDGEPLSLGASPTLAASADAGPDEPEDVPPAVFDREVRARLARLAHVAHGLAHLHGAGWVHCDLKPDNVLVSADGRVVLVDFGLVAWRGPRADPASIVEVARAAGTAAYMSPERARGEHFDARSDLYALGCMIHEAITGVVPYPRRSAGMALMAHLTAPLPRLEHTVPDLPAVLGALVRALLAKAPTDRPGHAQQVLSVFRAAGIDVPDLPLPRQGPLYAPGLVGREELLHQLVERCGGSFSSGGAATWLLGESGSGKSRLARGVVTELAPVRSPVVLVGEATAVPGPDGPRPSGVPLQLFLGPLRRAMDAAHGDGVALPADALALVRPFAPFLGGPRGSAPPDLDQLDAGRDRLHRAVLELLEPLTHGEPTLWVFDDLQWVDELSRGVLDVLLRRLPDEPWAVLGLCRTEGGRALPTTGEAVSLPPLTPPDVDRLVDGHLGDEAPAALRDWVRRHAGGNPFFVGECLRTAVAESFLTLAEDGRWHFAAERADDLVRRPIPATLGDLIGLRLRGLPATLRQVAEAAAVTGRTASLALLADVCGLDERRLGTAVGGLARRAVLVPDDDRVHFTHDRLAEHAYAQLDDGRCRELHQRVADVLEATGEDPARVPWHRERAGQQELARLGWLEVARAARGRFALDEAEAAYVASIRLATDAAIDARRELAVDVFVAQGRLDDAREQLQVALAAEPEEATAAELLFELARVQHGAGHWEQGMAALADAEALALRADRPDVVVKVLCERGAALVRQGRTGEGEALHRLALEQLPTDAEATARADVLRHLATSVHLQGRQDEAVELFRTCLAVLRDVGDLVRASQVLVTLGNTLVFIGRPDEGMEHYGEALELHRRLGNRRGEGYVLGNIASIHTREMRLDLGRRIRAEALAIHRETGNRRHEGILLRGVGLDAVNAGQLEEGLQALDAARRLLEEARDALWLAHIDAALGRVWRLFGDHGASRRHLERAEATYRGMGAGDLQCDAWLQRLQLALAADEDPTPWLVRIEGEAEGAPDNGIRGRALRQARALLAAVEGGEPMVAGERREDLPEPLLRCLSERRAP